MLRKFYGRKIFQSIFEHLFKNGLQGMNFYNAGDYRFSGEIRLFNYLKDKAILKSDKFVFFDIGAANGEYSSKFVSIFDSLDLECHLFEPSKLYFPDLTEKLSSNIFHINKNAIGYASQDIELYSCSELPGMNSIYNRNRDFWTFDLNYDYVENVSMTTIDEYCTNRGIKKIDFLKLDTEGNEFDCLKGAQRMLQESRIEHLLFEFGGTNVDARTYFYDFWSLLNEKYKIYRVLVDGLQPIDTYKNEHEIFVAVNYFAELKEK